MLPLWPVATGRFSLCSFPSHLYRTLGHPESATQFGVNSPDQTPHLGMHWGLQPLGGQTPSFMWLSVLHPTLKAGRKRPLAKLLRVAPARTSTGWERNMLELSFQVILVQKREYLAYEWKIYKHIT